MGEAIQQSIRLPQKLLRALDAEAKRRGTARAETIRALLWVALDALKRRGTDNGTR